MSTPNNEYLNKLSYWYVTFSERIGPQDSEYKVVSIGSIAADRLSVCTIAEVGNARNEKVKQHSNWIMEQRIKELTSRYDVEAVHVRKHFGWVVSVTIKTQDYDKVKC